MRATWAFGIAALAVVDADVAVDVEEAHRWPRCSTRRRASSAPEAFRAWWLARRVSLRAQGLDLGRAVEAEHAAQVLRSVFLERLGALDAPTAPS